MGGNHVTRDLAYGLEIDVPRAESIKRRFGSARRQGLGPGPTETRQEGGPTPEEHARIAAICEARQLETLELVARGLQWGITRPALSAGIVLSGGGSRLAGTEELAEQVFTLRADIRRAPGDDYDGEPDSWSTALGLVEHALEGRADREDPRRPALGRQRILADVKRWIQRIV